MNDKIKGVWRTINGAKVFIVNGLSVEESIKLREIEDAKNYLRRAYKRIVKNDTEQEITKALQYFLEHNGGNFIWIKK